MAIFGVAFSPLQVSVGMQVTEGVLTQEYNPDTSEYMPDRRIRPAAVLPVVTVKDPSGLIADGVANHLLADIYWYEGEISDAKAILDSNQNYKIDRTSDNANRGRITVYKNIPFNNPLTLAFKATLVDMSGGKVRRKTPVAGSVVLSTSTAAVSPVVLIQGYPRGNFYNILDTMKHLKLSAKLMAGTEEVPSAMWWYRKEGAKLTEITDYVGAKTGELQVPVADIGRLSKYVVKAQDCRKDLQALRDEWLDGELEKIRDYPRNLIAKQYLMDWNEVRAGITTKGEDGDGEYWRVSFADIRRYIGGSSDNNDIFQGKISFQPGTRYALKIKWKTESDLGFSPAAFVFVYTDGTTSGLINRYPITGEAALTEQLFVTEEGKDLKNIGSGYNKEGYVRIYDLQLTELHAENLLDRATPNDVSKYATVEEQAETLFGEKVWKVTNISVGQPPLLTKAAKLTKGKTYTASMYVKTGSIAGSELAKVVFYDAEASATLSYKILKEASPEWTQIALTFTPGKDYEKTFVYGYAGNGAGCETYVSCLKLEEGDTATPGYIPKWIPSADDLAAEAEQVQLPAEYRPATQGETEDGEYDLGMRMPNYTTRVVTPWGDDKEVVMIPPGVKLFPAWIQVDTPQGTLDEPEKYFSADWGNGLKGMQVLLDAEQIGTGTMVVEPEVHEDLSMARYGVGGATGDQSKLETVVDGTKLVVEFVANENSGEYWFNDVDSAGNGAAVICSGGHMSVVFIHGGNRRSFTSVGNVDGHLHRAELAWDSGETGNRALFDGREVALNTVVNASTNQSLTIPPSAMVTLAEIYSPDGTLLHKWDMEGATDDERLADKAVTENKINLSKSTGFKLTPI